MLHDSQVGRFGALLPYAAASLVIALASTLVIVVASGDIAARPDATPSAPAAEERTAGPRVELSASGRLAYWRAEPNGGAQLWVSNVDGSLRRPIARADDVRRVSLTRWLPDGSGVSWIYGGTSFLAAKLDGGRWELELSPITRRDYRFRDIRWSPDATTVAATLRTSDNRSDIWTASYGGSAWARATTLDDAAASDWIAPREVLVHTASGMLGVLAAGTQNMLRPLTGLTATTPFVASDGRVHFLAGSVVLRDPSTGEITSVSASVWSINADGGELRRETQQAVDDIRLDGQWPDGRYLVRRGTSIAQALLGTDLSVLPTGAGVIERVVVSADGRSAIGLTANRIVRLDVGRVAARAPDAAVVLLDGVNAGDAWVPRELRIARSATAPERQRPDAAYAFTLAGDVWLMASDGTTSLVRINTGEDLPRGARVIPVWSPAGDRVAVIERARQGFALVTIGRNGAAAGQAQAANVALAPPAWSPDGTALAVVVLTVGTSPFDVTTEHEIRVLPVDGASAPSPLSGREVVWTRGGLIVLSNGAFRSDLRGRAGHSIDIVPLDGVAPVAPQRRVLTDAARLAADPRALVEPGRANDMQLAELRASADGTYASVRLAPTGSTTAPRSLVIVRLTDGAVMWATPGETVSDVAWSPAAQRVGLSVAAPEGSATDRLSTSPLVRSASRTVIRDGATGGTVAEVEGRFAGWSPDGEWWYVARDDGLYAYRSGGSDATRIGPVGTAVAVTRR